MTDQFRQQSVSISGRGLRDRGVVLRRAASQPERPKTPGQKGGAQVIADAHRQGIAREQGKRHGDPEIGRVAEGGADLERGMNDGPDLTRNQLDHQHPRRNRTRGKQCDQGEIRMNPSFEQQSHHADGDAETHQGCGQRAGPRRPQASNQEAQAQGGNQLGKQTNDGSFTRSRIQTLSISPVDWLNRRRHVLNEFRRGHACLHHRMDVQRGC